MHKYKKKWFFEKEIQKKNGREKKDQYHQREKVDEKIEKVNNNILKKRR